MLRQSLCVGYYQTRAIQIVVFYYKMHPDYRAECNSRLFSLNPLQTPTQRWCKRPTTRSYTTCTISLDIIMHSPFILHISGTSSTQLLNLGQILFVFILYEYSLKHEPKWIPKHLAERDTKSRPKLRTTLEKDRYHIGGIY